MERVTTGRRPTIKMIAAEAGVSIATVSYILNPRPAGSSRSTVSFSPATRERVVSTAERLGYAPNQNARRMRRGRTDQICVVAGDFTTPWTQALGHAVATTAAPAGLSTSLLLDGDWVASLASQSYDGVVIASEVTPEQLRTLTQLAEQGLKVVLLDTDIEPTAFDVVLQEQHPAVDEMIDELAGRHSRIGYLWSDVGAGSRDRLASYRAGLARAGLSADPALVRQVAPERHLAHRAALEMLMRPDPPTAIASSNDLGAVGALWAAYRLGLDVPGQLEIVGVGNSPESRTSDPPLTSIGADSLFDLVAEIIVGRVTDADLGPHRTHSCTWSIHRRGTTLPPVLRK